MTQTRNTKHLAALALLVGTTVACGDIVRQSQSPVSLVVTSLTGGQGRTGGSTVFSGVLLSDVITSVTQPAPCSVTSPCQTYFDDIGQITVSSAMKDITVAPSANNVVTLSRYHVSYRRADGRNTPGVDVPYPFDGALTLTVVGGGSATGTFELVRHVAKLETPLVQLQSNATVITTLADVTFYGTDRVGNDLSVTGSIQINFGNFADQ
jgi:hypothetical protein